MMAKIWQIIHLNAVEKEKERLSFIFRVFPRKDGLIGFARRCNDFSLCLTTFELQQFVYACVLKASILALAGLRAKVIIKYYVYASSFISS